MMTKKTEKGNSEKYRRLFSKLRFITALGVFIIAFGWTSKAAKAEEEIITIQVKLLLRRYHFNKSKLPILAKKQI